ncbi:SDR family NAD(P)-dependent oxidoreductase [Pseudomonas sp.]|uniref:SDR family NAD(P)-dependent oxidoreductase n=1 Tax=Pseudomonas sp. TaxID=306 RepID=UPI003D13829C
MDGLKDKVIIIAGGALGIGAATARRLARDGAKVVIGDLNEKGAAATAASICDAGGVASSIGFDMTDEQSIKAMFDHAIERYGKLDGLHNNAADFKVMEGDSNILDITLEAWERTFKVDLTGFFLTMRHAIPLMLKQGGGSIVNTSSAAAFVAMPNLPAYSAAKAGVVSLTRHVAVLYGRQGIRCNNVGPGAVRTESADAAAEATGDPGWWDRVRDTISHSNRNGRPEDLGSMVALLMSDEGSWINGQSIKVDGGWVID